MFYRPGFEEGAELAAALAALPAGCWPAIRLVGSRRLVPAAAAGLPRLCPRLTPCFPAAAEQPS